MPDQVDQQDAQADHHARHGVRREGEHVKSDPESAFRPDQHPGHGQADSHGQERRRDPEDQRIADRLMELLVVEHLDVGIGRHARDRFRAGDGEERLQTGPDHDQCREDQGDHGVRRRQGKRWHLPDPQAHTTRLIAVTRDRRVALRPPDDPVVEDQRAQGQREQEHAVGRRQSEVRQSARWS
jgi:hypothetical protein